LTIVPHVEIAAVRITLEGFLHQQGQRVHAAAHIGMARRNPYPYPPKESGSSSLEHLNHPRQCSSINSGIDDHPAPTSHHNFQPTAHPTGIAETCGPRVGNHPRRDKPSLGAAAHQQPGLKSPAPSIQLRSRYPVPPRG
jgi:hypothetical protein